MLTYFEYQDYLFAEERIQELQAEYQRTRQGIYQEIQPTLTTYNTDLGTIYVKSVSVEEYGVALGILYEFYQNRIHECEERIELLNEAISLLYDDERAEYEAWIRNSRRGQPEVLNALKQCLEYVLLSAKDSQKVEKDNSQEVENDSPQVEKEENLLDSDVIENVMSDEIIAATMTVEEWDAFIDSLDNKELFTNYYDRDGSFDRHIEVISNPTTK